MPRYLSTAWECPEGWYGGLGVYVSKLLPEVAKDGEVLHVCYHGSYDAFRQYDYRGARVLRLHEPYVDRSGGVANLQALAFARDAVNLVPYFDALLAHDIHSSLLVVAAHELGVDSLYFTHTAGYVLPLDLAGVFYSRTVVANSKLTASMIEQHYGEWVKGKVRVVYPAPPVKPTSEYRRKNNEKPVVVVPSRYQYNKDPGHVLKQLEEARGKVDFRVYVFGRGAELYKLPEWVVNLGTVDEDRKYKVLESADLVLQVGFPEPFGLVALEAIACGTPVLVSSSSGCAEVLPGEAVYSLENLAERLVQLLSDPRLREELWWRERRSRIMSRSWRDVWREVRHG